MKTLFVLLFATVLSTAAFATQDKPAPAKTQNLAGLHDFDFLHGSWHVKHRKLKERLANSRDWAEFDGSITVRPLMDGWGNVGDNVFNLPDGEYRGASLRAYDPQTGQWSSWWLDSRNPAGNLDPPIKGSFKDGIGTFYAEDTLRGKPVRVKTIWSHITPTSARWEQSYSSDGGKTYELNWTSDFQRVP